jgi:hypothetical protein
MRGMRGIRGIRGMRGMRGMRGEKRMPSAKAPGYFQKRSPKAEPARRGC